MLILVADEMRAVELSLSPPSTPSFPRWLSVESEC